MTYFLIDVACIIFLFLIAVFLYRVVSFLASIAFLFLLVFIISSVYVFVYCLAEDASDLFAFVSLIVFIIFLLVFFFYLIYKANKTRYFLTLVMSLLAFKLFSDLLMDFFLECLINKQLDLFACYSLVVIIVFSIVFFFYYLYKLYIIKHPIKNVKSVEISELDKQIENIKNETKDVEMIRRYYESGFNSKEAKKFIEQVNTLRFNTQRLLADTQCFLRESEEELEITKLWNNKSSWMSPRSYFMSRGDSRKKEIAIEELEYLNEKIENLRKFIEHVSGPKKEIIELEQLSDSIDNLKVK